MSVTYWYKGRSPQTGEWLRLPRTQAAETWARELMQVLAQDERYNREGKMYGVLLVESSSGEQQVLRAFSGALNGERVVEGWVPPIPGRAEVAVEEASTLAQLETMKQEIMVLQQLPERSPLALLTQQLTEQQQQLATLHQQRKQSRQHQRRTLQATLTGHQLEVALKALDHQSQQDGIERRRLKQQYSEQIQSLRYIVEQADSRIQHLKQQRKQLSRQLQALMDETYRLTNFSGASSSLQQLMTDGRMPTGTGDCCAPKLLHYAATHGFKPIAMAEFWWGTPSIQDDRIPGEFYEACRDRCQPLMGFLLSGLASFSAIASHSTLPILYEDEWIIAVDKPAGLLSVPGRYCDRQDSVLSRLRSSYPSLKTVHRLDQDTSGILLLARDLSTYRHLSQQFEQRQVHKVYEALIAGTITVDDGIINQPLWGNPSDRPRQCVDWHRGKLSLTKFRVLAHERTVTRIEFFPLTGRTHQLRVHALVGLGAPILGDRLYQSSFDEADSLTRLHLHAKELIVQHPHTGRSLNLQSTVPF